MRPKSTKRRSAYDRWRCILRACYEPSRRSYAQYGARGIRVAPSWDNQVTGLAFENFYTWLCEELDKLDDPIQYWVVRRDTNADFSPQNCYISLVHPMTAKCERVPSAEEITAVKQLAKKNVGKLCVRTAAVKLRVPKARVYRILGTMGFDLSRFNPRRLPGLVSCVL